MVDNAVLIHPRIRDGCAFVLDLVLTGYCHVEAGGAPEIPAPGQQLLTPALLFGTP
jgi:hypothetical protein